MEEKWYFVEDGERKGPVSKKDILKLIDAGKLSDDSYVWVKGFDDWKKIADCDEFQVDNKKKIESLKSEKTEKQVMSEEDKTQEFNEMQVDRDKTVLNLGALEPNKKVVYIKTGLDRGGKAAEYGPYNLGMVKKLYKSKRINGKTLVFFPGLNVWRVLASFEDFEQVFEELPPVIEDNDKRVWERKPFTARLFFTNNDQFFEGICKDISLGGMKVLIDNLPVELGEEISLNVHPEEEGHQFVAKAKIVRLLDDDNGFSLQFVDLSKEAKSAISSYLATH